MGLSQGKEMKTEHEYHQEMMTLPIKELGERLSQLNLDRCKIQILEWTKPEEVKFLHDALKKFYPEYNPDINTSNGINKISILNELFSSEDHIHITHVTLCHFEMRLFRKYYSCNVWKKDREKIKSTRSMSKWFVAKAGSTILYIINKRQ